MRLEAAQSRCCARRGFSLIELLVVVSILALLLAVLLPGLSRARRMAASTVCGSNLRQVGHAFELYLSDHRDTYPAAVDPVSTSPFYTLWMGRGFRGYIGPYLVKDINVENPSVLVCPGDKTDPGVFERTSYAYSMTFYLSPGTIDAWTSWSAYFAAPPGPEPQTALAVRYTGRKVLSGEWGSHHYPLGGKDDGWWDRRGRRNFLFADGHVDLHAAHSLEPAHDGAPDPLLTVHGIRGFDIR